MWEPIAVVLTIASVLLAVKRSLWQFPVGIAASSVFLIVFAQSKLYASGALQIVFIAVQIYGWWYWLRGDHGARPKFTSIPALHLIGLCVAAGVLALSGGAALNAFTNAEMATADAGLFGLSIVAQALLDRKIVQTWLVWALVNLLSIWVYGAQGLLMTSLLYLALLANTAWGYWEWRGAMRRQSAA